MSSDTAVEDVLDLVAARIDVLTRLDGDRLRKRDLVDELDCSRSTVNRATARLADAGLIDDTPRGCRTTFLGSLLADRYRDYVGTVGDVVRAREVLAPLPADADLPAFVLADAVVATPGSPSPYEPYHAVEAVLERPGPEGRVRVYVPAFSNPHGLDLARGLASEVPVEIVFGEELLAALQSDFPGEMAALRKLELFSGYRTDEGPTYTLVVADSGSRTEGIVVTHTEDRNLGGTIVTRDPDAVRWIERRYLDVRSASEPLETADA
ncbi:helix-turn-helix transcriptional regulator [Haloplanus halophilus]|uniref:helix-turn-helix transcriptional regulator n=1 Tax=Haloplanus halophilus TaxID=2949993 RepID=UPI00203A58AC|nr:GntR family transcriptional regulator [Haloplanus sp. GDY1]